MLVTFSHDSNSFGPKIFRFKVLTFFLSDFFKLTCWINDATKLRSTLSLTPLSLTPWFHWYFWVWLHGYIDITESDSMVSLTPLILTPWFHWHHWVWLHGFIDSTESDYMVSLTPLSRTPWFHWHLWVELHGFIDSTESDSMVTLTLRSFTMPKRSQKSIFVMTCKCF